MCKKKNGRRKLYESIHEETITKEKFSLFHASFSGVFISVSWKEKSV